MKLSPGIVSQPKIGQLVPSVMGEQRYVAAAAKSLQS